MARKCKAQKKSNLYVKFVMEKGRFTVDAHGGDLKVHAQGKTGSLPVIGKGMQFGELAKTMAAMMPGATQAYAPCPHPDDPNNFVQAEPREMFNGLGEHSPPEVLEAFLHTYKDYAAYRVAADAEDAFVRKLFEAAKPRSASKPVKKRRTPRKKPAGPQPAAEIKPS